MPATPGPPPATSETYFVEALKEMLDLEGLSQQALADAMSERGHRFHQATIYKILRGSRKVTLDEAVDIADILGEELATMTVPPHEATIRRAMSRTSYALAQIENAASNFLQQRYGVIDLLDARDDWDPKTREAAEIWRVDGWAESALGRGLARSEEQRRFFANARVVVDEDAPNVKEAQEQHGEHPEAP